MKIHADWGIWVLFQKKGRKLKFSAKGLKIEGGFAS